LRHGREENLVVSLVRKICELDRIRIRRESAI